LTNNNFYGKLGEKNEGDKKFPITVRYGTVYFTVKDMVKWLPVKASTIDKYLRSGKIKGRKFGKKWYVTRENFYRFLEGK